eukprot:1674171-Amphidinium_carterae.1
MELVEVPWHIEQEDRQGSIEERRSQWECRQHPTVSGAVSIHRKLTALKLLNTIVTATYIGSLQTRLVPNPTFCPKKFKNY